LDQYELIHSSKWDVLLILDACRADFFEQLYPKYLSAERYSRALSRGCPTQIWFARTFPGRYEDIAYLSGNPYISSLPAAKKVVGFLASERFLVVDDVFTWGWESVDGIETVPPWRVNEAVRRWRCLLEEGYRIIAHYMQPHSPYIGRVKLDIGSFKAAVKQALGEVFREPKPMVRHELLREAYMCNLELALQYVSELLVELRGYKVAVTSDHGELLGENGRVGHLDDSPELRVVPWLEVKA